MVRWCKHLQHSPNKIRNKKSKLSALSFEPSVRVQDYAGLESVTL